MRINEKVFIGAALIGCTQYDFGDNWLTIEKVLIDNKPVGFVVHKPNKIHPREWFSINKTPKAYGHLEVHVIMGGKGERNRYE